MYSPIGASRSAYAARAPQRTDALEKATLSSEAQKFIKELVQINNTLGMDGRLDRESLLKQMKQLNADNENWGILRFPPHPCSKPTKRSGSLKDAAASALGQVKNTSDLIRTMKLLDSHEIVEELKPDLKEKAALSMLSVRSDSDKDLAMAIAKARAEEGTPLDVLLRDHGKLGESDVVELETAMANGFVGDLAAAGVSCNYLMADFGMAGGRDVLQWKAVNGAAGEAVEAGLPFEAALLRYGFYYGHPSTQELWRKAQAALPPDHRSTT